MSTYGLGVVSVREPLMNLSLTDAVLEIRHLVIPFTIKIVLGVTQT